LQALRWDLGFPVAQLGKSDDCLGSDGESDSEHGPSTYNYLRPFNITQIDYQNYRLLQEESVTIMIVSISSLVLVAPASGYMDDLK
jgi:hypothetical protein